MSVLIRGGGITVVLVAVVRVWGWAAGSVLLPTLVDTWAPRPVLNA
jgi:hypothetical protein